MCLSFGIYFRYQSYKCYSLHFPLWIFFQLINKSIFPTFSFFHLRNSWNICLISGLYLCLLFGVYFRSYKCYSLHFPLWIFFQLINKSIFPTFSFFHLRNSWKMNHRNSTHCLKFNRKEEKPSHWKCRQISYILEV